jgi:hypothetical protein
MIDMPPCVNGKYNILYNVIIYPYLRVCKRMHIIIDRRTPSVNHLLGRSSKTQKTFFRIHLHYNDI